MRPEMGHPAIFLSVPYFNAAAIWTMIISDGDSNRHYLLVLLFA